MAAEFLSALDLDGLQLALLVVVMAVAAVVRGYSGFGFSAIVIASASLLIPPAKLVPILYILEIAASLHMFPSIRRDLDTPLYWPMVAGAALGIPAGQALLTYWPADTVRIVLSLTVLVCTCLLWAGFRLGRGMTPPLALLTGAGTGFGSGLAAMGGLIMIPLLLATDYPAAKTRAMCVALFLVMYPYGIGVSVVNGLVSAATIWTSLVLSVPLLVGLLIGQRQYLLTSPERFRQFVLLLLVVLALIGIVRALVI